MIETVRRLRVEELYRFLPSATGTVVIENTRGEQKNYTRGELEWLLSTELNHHFREMYEAALAKLNG